MHFGNFNIIAALAASAAAVPFTSHVVHERREFVPKAWIKQNRVDAAAKLPVRIGMTQSNLENGHDLLMDV